MSDLLQKGSDWLADKFKTFASRSITYIRGVDEVTLLATVGRTLLRLDDGMGRTWTEWTDRDFLIQAADLIPAGQPTLPERGDRIREVQGTTTYLYEVMAPGNEPAWRWSDPYRKVLRIHTKEIGVL